MTNSAKDCTVFFQPSVSYAKATNHTHHLFPLTYMAVVPDISNIKCYLIAYDAKVMPWIVVILQHMVIYTEATNSIQYGSFSLVVSVVSDNYVTYLYFIGELHKQCHLLIYAFQHRILQLSFITSYPLPRYVNHRLLVHQLQTYGNVMDHSA